MGLDVGGPNRPPGPRGVNSTPLSGGALRTVSKGGPRRARCGADTGLQGLPDRVVKRREFSRRQDRLEAHLVLGMAGHWHEAQQLEVVTMVATYDGQGELVGGPLLNDGG